MKMLRYTGSQERVFVTGPLTGPVEPDQVVSVTDEDAEVMLAGGTWEDVTPKPKGGTTTQKSK